MTLPEFVEELLLDASRFQKMWQAGMKHRPNEYAANMTKEQWLREYDKYLEED